MLRTGAVAQQPLKWQHLMLQTQLNASSANRWMNSGIEACCALAAIVMNRK